MVLSGCAVEAVPPPQATLANIQAVRGANFAPMRVGVFVAGPGAPAAMDKKITVRAGTQAAPSGSYAKLLGETLEAELKGAGKFDPNAVLVVSGEVIGTHVDSAIPNGNAALQAHFTLKKSGVVAFDKSLQVKSTWASNMIGAVAIPDAFNHYNALFADIVTRLLSDPDFRAAARPSSP
ncbi:MAG: hypothetical protein JWQ29_1481 [Phenylobacterium sp.]|nr:hypothetical protein [Phenylobacterium sp.]